MNYTIIAYKSSGETTCRGCTMDSWDSDFESRTFVDKDKAIAWASNFYYKNKIELGSYELTYLVNGFPLDYFNFDGESDDDYYELEDTHRHMDSDASKIASDKYEEYKSMREIERVSTIQREQDRKKAYDLELLAKLKEQYGDNHE